MSGLRLNFRVSIEGDADLKQLISDGFIIEEDLADAIRENDQDKLKQILSEVFDLVGSDMIARRDIIIDAINTSERCISIRLEETEVINNLEANEV